MSDFILTDQFFQELRAGIVSARTEGDNVSLTPEEAAAILDIAAAHAEFMTLLAKMSRLAESLVPTAIEEKQP